MSELLPVQIQEPPHAPATDAPAPSSATDSPEDPTVPMLDVHPPHHAAHTWRDFLIHIATIVVGLLIAIGLEQSVEALHHHHQRHQLEADLRAEGIRNLHIAITTLDYCDWMARWQSEQARELDHAAAQGRTPVYIQSPPKHTLPFSRPSDAVWTVAQTSNMLGLLPRSEAERYAHDYYDAHVATGQLEHINELLYERAEVLDAAAVDPNTGPLAMHENAAHDLSRMNKEQLDRLREITGHLIVESRNDANYTLTMYALTWGTLNGFSDDENTRSRSEVNAAYFHDGGTAGLLKKFPIPAENSPAPEENR